MRWGLFFLFLSAALPAVEVYRCVDADGGVAFQQHPCIGGGGRIEVGEVQAAWSGLRPSERTLYRHYRERDARRAEAGRRKRVQAAATGERASDRTCYGKRSALERVQARLRSGYRPEEGDRLRLRRDQLEGYLRRFCR